MPSTLYLSAGVSVDLTRSLGKGCFGRVYEACASERRDRIVAKIMVLKHNDVKASYARETAAYRCLYAHAKRASISLPHPNIVHYMGHDEASNLGVIVLERLQGTTLETFMADHPDGLSLADVVSIATGVARGLETLHAAGISVRDLKPDNIHYDPATGTVKLFDFGFAELVDPGEKRLYNTGSPIFMAPECIFRRRHESKPFDMWCLGQVMYVLATGHASFHACKTMNDLKVAMKERVVYYPPDMHTSLRYVIERLLDFNPDQRWTAGMACVGLQCLSMLTRDATM